MAQTKIILDSNSYFRLAQNIHPLLRTPFGAQEFTLYIHADLTKEFKASSRLQNKFHWVSDPEYVSNRKGSLPLSKKQKEEIEETYDFIWSYVRDEYHRKRKKGPSPVDSYILAIAAVLQIRVVTDDQDMIEVAEIYGIHQLTSLELMQLMLENEHIEMSKVEQVVAQWQYENDVPYSEWKSEYKKLFGTDPPIQ